MEPQKLIVIVGETGSGKSALALDLALRFNGEIICADSRTVYKGMDIGTAKPSKQDQQTIKHYLLDVAEPNQAFNVAMFKKKAQKAIDDIYDKGKLPILVGGTGLYVDSVIFDFKFSKHGAERDSKNPRHLKKSVQKDNSLRPNTLIIGLKIESEELDKHLKTRVEHMVQMGFVDEVKRLIAKFGPNIPALQAPGYRAFLNYIEGSITLEQAKAQFVQNDRKLAKKQRTWFKRHKFIQWVADKREIVEIVTTFLNTKSI